MIQNFRTTIDQLDLLVS